MSQHDALEREREVFEAHVNEWRQTRPGHFVLIKGDEVVGFFESLDAAFGEGTRRFGLQEFFVKQIMPSDVVNISLFGRRLLST